MLLLSVVMELTPQLLETQQFPEKWRGYDQDAVDDFLERVGVAVAELQERLRSANARIESLEASREASETAPAAGLTAEDEAQQVGRALILAQQAADTALEEARAEAARMVADAESEARALTAAAAEESERTRGGARAEAERILSDARAEAEQMVARATEEAAAAEARRDDADAHMAALEAEILAGARAEAEKLTNEARDAAAVERHRATIKAEKAAAAVKEANRAEIAELERTVIELRKRRTSLIGELKSRTRDLGGISDAIGDLLDRMSSVTAEVDTEAEAAETEETSTESITGPMGGIDTGGVSAPVGEIGSHEADTDEFTSDDEAAPGGSETLGEFARGEQAEEPGQSGESDASDVVIDLTGSQPRVSGTGASGPDGSGGATENAPEGLPRWALVGESDQDGHPSRTANLQVVADNTGSAPAGTATAVATEDTAESAPETAHLTLARDPGPALEPASPVSVSEAPAAVVESAAPAAASSVSEAPAGLVESAAPAAPEATTVVAEPESPVAAGSVNDVMDVVEEESVTLEVLEPPSPREATPPVSAGGDDSSEAEAFWNEPGSVEAQATEDVVPDNDEAILEDPFLAALKGPESVEFDGSGRPGPDRPGRRRRRRR